MEAEYHKLKAVSSFKYKIDTAAAPSSLSRQGSETDELPRFSKLRTIPSFKHVLDAEASPAALSREGSETDEIPRFQKLRAVPSFKHLMEAAAISRQGSETDGGELPRYTSLKDVMANLSPRGGGSVAGSGAGGEIAIRNELVKHAASAYVLSATVVNPAHRDGGQDSRIYERMRMCGLGFLPCWQIHVGLPLEELCWPLLDFVYAMVRRVRNGLRGVVEIT